MRRLVPLVGVLLACLLISSCKQSAANTADTSVTASASDANTAMTPANAETPTRNEASAAAPAPKGAAAAPLQRPIRHLLVPQGGGEPGPQPQSAPAQEVPCGVTNTELTPSDCKAAGAWADQATNGTASFEAPTAMRQGDTKIVQLAVGTRPPPGGTPANSIQPTADQIHQAVTNGEGQVIDYHPLVGRRMAADLSGVGFDIVQVGDRVQQVADNNITMWQWQIKAKDRGRETLVLRTAVTMLDSNGVETSLAPTTTTRIVTVAVGQATIMSFLSSLQGFIAAVTAVVVAVSALYFAIRHFGAKGGAGGAS